MIWTAWNNGKKHPKGVGYGFKIGAEDRDRYFKRYWRLIEIELPSPSGNIVAKVNVGKESFWSGCRELISEVIGRWMLDEGFTPWRAHKPPKFKVDLLKAGSFRIIGPATSE
jgi:hypothetical protein